MRFVEASEQGRGETMLHAHRFLLRIGLAIGNVFAWVFVFEYFSILSSSVPRALAGVLVVYAFSQVVTILATPIGAAYLRKGTQKMFLWSLVFAASAFVVLGATLGGFFDEKPAAWGIVLFAALLGLYRALYFIPYALNREADTRPRSHLLYEVLLALVPAFAGATLVLQAFAPLRLLFGAAFFAAAAVFPIAFLPDIRERFSFTYERTFQELFSPRNRYLVWSSFLEGIQGAALFLIWPLIVFLIVGWSYMLLGLVFTATLLAMLLFRILYRNFVPAREMSTPVRVVLAMSGWVGRLAAGTPLAVIVADSYAYTVHPERGTLSDPFAFEQAADNGSFVDEYTALKEIALAGGRIALSLTIGALVFSIPLIFAFGAAIALAALASGLSVLLARRTGSAAY